jgi:hypothetical protein
MAVALETLVEIGWCWLTVVNEATDLTIVELVANDSIDAVHWRTSSNVLTILATILSTTDTLVLHSINRIKSKDTYVLWA